MRCLPFLLACCLLLPSFATAGEESPPPGNSPEAKEQAAKERARAGRIGRDLLSHDEAIRREAVDGLLALKHSSDLSDSMPIQASLAEFISNGEYDRHLARLRPELCARRNALLEALQEHMPPGSTWTRPEGGLFVWVTLPRGFDGQELLLAAQQRGVRYSHGDLFHSNADGNHTLRLTYSAATPSQIESGVATLGELVREHWPADQDARERKPVETLPIL